MNKRYVWCSVHCEGERSQSAVLSWFKPIVPDSYGMPIKADIQEDIQTGAEKVIRALFRLPDGRLREAQRRRSGGSVTFRLLDATPSILKDYDR